MFLLRFALPLVALAMSTVLGELSKIVAQEIKPEPRDSEMTDLLPIVGLGVENHTLFDASGNPVSTSTFRDRYTVVVFGCLT